MKNIALRRRGLFLIICFPQILFSQFAVNQTPTYPKLVHFYDSLAKKGQIELYNMGNSDYGLPIYLCVLNGENDSIKTFQNFKNQTAILINNGIHPGEPDGINACGKITLDYVKKDLKFDKNVSFSFILCYNVDGMMNRSTSSRANQNGPEEYGFRGNAQNLDLNRDFIKMDSENAFTFVKIFQAINPDIFIDTHVSNGADYQYTLTLIHSLKERLEPAYRTLTYKHFIPDLELAMQKHSVDLFPYVESLEEIPDKGIVAFNDLPRYANGYASLFSCISVTTETHMLKPFPQRVEATYLYLKELANWSKKNHKTIKNVRRLALESLEKDKFHSYNYKLTEQKDSILFKGFEHDYKKSTVTGLDRLFYDRAKPFERYIPHYKTYKTSDSTKIPSFYILSSQCKDVVLRLKQNQVEMKEIRHDSLVNLTFFRVRNYKSGTKPYEGHFLHSAMEIEEQEGKIQLKKGDFLISTKQAKKKFICSVLEPETEDSYFAWNFFDSYLQEKEYFSDYVFEDLAVKILEQSSELRSLFEEKKKNDAKFASNQWEQLYFIYQNSQYFEASFMRLPVFKVY
ncbi:MAG: hypothetical protein V4622_09245 [Bacteroidota bacterium]